jgi:ferredoxin
VLTDLEEIELKLVYFLEDAGFPSITVPPVHFDPRHYDPKGNTRGPLSLAHAAVEAGLGTLGLNLMLLTPEYGPRVMLGAVLTSAELEPDRPLGEALCQGEACGRCLLACPADAIGQWTLDKDAALRSHRPTGSPISWGTSSASCSLRVKSSSRPEVEGVIHELAVDPARVGVYSAARAAWTCAGRARLRGALEGRAREIAERTRRTRLEMARRRESGTKGSHAPPAGFGNCGGAWDVALT